jgi:hypothetical protein
MLGRRTILAFAALPLLLLTAQRWPADGLPEYVKRWPRVSFPDPLNVFPTLPPSQTLHHKLVMHLPLNELSGTRVNAAGTCGSDCNATAVNAPGAGGGAGSYGLQLTGGANQALTIADNASLSLGADSAFTVMAWYRPDALSATSKALIAKWGGAGTSNVREYVLQVTDVSSFFSVGNGTANVGFNTALGLVAGTRQLVVATHDPATDRVRVSAGGGAYSDVAWAGGTFDGDGTVAIGKNGTHGTGVSDVNASVDVAAFWKDVSFTQEQVTTLYNSGKGSNCASIAASGLPQPTACWDLDEASGTRYASTVGTCTTDCNLSAVAAPGRTAGLVENGMGMSLVTNSTQTLRFNDNASVSPSGSMTTCAWVSPVAISVGANLWGKWGALGNREWALYANAAVVFTTAAEGAGAVNTTGPANSFVARSWAFVCGEFNKATARQRTATNNVWGTAFTQTAIFDGTNGFVIGGSDLPSTSAGSYDAMSLWHRTLTDSEHTALYAAGAGVPWPWTSLADGLLAKPLNWADRSDESKQRAVYAYTGVVVPAEMLPFRSRKVYVR